MKGIIIRLLAIISLSTLFLNCRVFKKDKAYKKQSSIENILIYYGEEIYERENCSKCHTRQVINANNGIISLDGYGKERPSEFILMFLKYPTSILPGIQNHSYEYLFEKEFDKSIIRNIIKKRHFNKNISFDKIWNKLVHHSDSLAKEMQLQNQFFNAKKRSEAIALVAFLKNIPSSKTKLKADSLFEKKWMDIVLGINDIVLKVANNKDNINLGKTLFLDYCASCHNRDGTGLIGPNLTDNVWIYGGNILEIAKSIIFGIPERGMLPFKKSLSPTEIGEIISYLNSINKSKY